MLDICEALKRIGTAGAPKNLRDFIERWFVPVEVRAAGDPAGLFTGYFEPELDGSRVPVEAGEVLYLRPPELVDVDLMAFLSSPGGRRIAGRVEGNRLVPFPSRAEIYAGALSQRGLELVWVHDPVEAFFLHIQGSGRVRFEDGSVMRVGYAGVNGRPYHAIGRSLVRRGELALEDVSLSAIAGWLRSHPLEARTLMEENPSYVFFRELPGEGPIGASGAVLTPGRSLAVDNRHIPWHLPVWVATEVPVPNGGTEPFARLLMVQDVGGAIKGPARADVFFGHGPEARERAGRMRSEGRIWVLVPRTMSEHIPR